MTKDASGCSACALKPAPRSLEQRYVSKIKNGAWSLGFNSPDPRSYFVSLSFSRSFVCVSWISTILESSSRPLVDGAYICLPAQIAIIYHFLFVEFI